MAAMAAAQLLDELMGRDRNLAPNDKKKESRWDDQQICKHYLVQFCPNELFINTRADLGPCEKIHDDFLKKEYETSTSYQKMGYEDEFVRFCQGMLSDVERRIRRGKQRLSLGTQEGGIPTPTQVKNNDDQIVMLSERINGLLEQVEALGCEGKVEEAQGMMKLCDQLKDERENLRKANENSHWFQTAEIAAAQEKQMEVCEVCGAFLIVGDAQQRVDDHLMGKQHVGYARIKGALEEIMEKRQKKKEDRALLRDKERQDRLNKQKELEKEREKEMEDRRKKRDEDRRRPDKRRSKSRSRDRERERDRSKRSRSRNRDRDRDRDRAKRSHSRERGGGRSRGRSRERHRSRGRSRNRSHRRSSHGREKRRSKSRSRGRDSNRKSRRSGSRSRSKEGRHGSRDRGHTREHRRDSHHKSKTHDSREDRSNGSPKRSKSDDKSKDTQNDSDDSNRSPMETDKVVGSKSHSGSPPNGVSPASSPDRTAITAEPNGAKCEGDSEQ